MHKQEQEDNQKREEILQEKLDTEKTKDMLVAFPKMLKNVKRFKDQEFPGKEDVLGEFAQFVDKWESFPENKKQLIKGTMEARDVKQGKLGDCYFISALGVLGHNWICRLLGMEYEMNGKKMPQRWKNEKGAYMISFYKFQKEVFVVIDDRLPVTGTGAFSFGASEDPD